MAITSSRILSMIILVIISTTICQEEKTNSFSSCIGNTKFISNLEENIVKLIQKKISFNSFTNSLNIWALSEDIQNFKNCYLVNQSDKIFESGTILTKIGKTILLATNCQKDIGPALIILDNFISNIKNIKDEWKNLLIDGLLLAIVGNQSINDCKSSWEAIKEIWNIGKIGNENKFLN